MRPTRESLPGRILRRRSLAVEVASALREELDAGTWPDFLPAENSLAEQLQVGRNSLRTALQLLAREKRIRIEHGHRTRVLHPSGAPAKPQRSIIGLVHPVPVSESSSITLFIIEEIRWHLHAAGHEILVLVDRRLQTRSPERALEKLVQQSGANAWVLFSQLERVQRWFMDRRLPTLLVGSPHAGIELPGLDADHRALGRHAVGQLVRLQHRRMALLIGRWGVAGDRMLEAAFRQTAAQHGLSRAAARIVHHDGSSGGICAAMKMLFRGADRPTALLVAFPREAITVAGWLQREGLRIPQDVSIICRDSDDILRYTVPAIAHYVVNWERGTRRLAHMILKLIADGHLPPQQHYVLPRFRNHESLAKASG